MTSRPLSSWTTPPRIGLADSWKTVRLELAKADGFPEGSASRVFLLRLPLDATDRVDDQAIAAAPRMAAFSRFWPSERDLRGTIVALGGRYVLKAGRDGPAELGALELGDEALAVGRVVAFTPRGDGPVLAFRVRAVTGRLKTALSTWRDAGYRSRGTGPR